MKAFLLSILVMALIAVGADFALKHAGFSAEDKASAPSVRLD